MYISSIKFNYEPHIFAVRIFTSFILVGTLWRVPGKFHKFEYIGCPTKKCICDFCEERKGHMRVTEIEIIRILTAVCESIFLTNSILSLSKYPSNHVLKSYL